MTARFDNAVAHDTLKARTVEDTFRFHAALVGLHDCLFNTFVESFESGDWYAYQGTWSIADGVATATAIGSTRGTVLFWQGDGYDTIPENIAVDVDWVDGDTGGIAIRGESTTSWFLVRWGPSYVEIMSGAASTRIIKLPKTLTSPAHIRVVVRDFALSDNVNDWYRSISLWADDTLIISDAWNIDLNNDDAGLRVGVYALWTDAAYENFRISELTELVDFEAVELGRSVGESLNRILTGRFVRWFIRGNGQIKAWLAGPTDPVYELTLAQVTEYDRERDWRNLASHVRIVGGYEEGDVLDSTMYNEFGTRFFYNSNPVLETLEEAQRAASQGMTTIKEEYERLTIRAEGQPLLEHHDHITIDEEEWIIEDIRLEVDAGKLYSQLLCRRYISVS